MLYIYRLFVWSNLNFLHNSQWITSPTQSCLVLYFALICFLRLICDWSFRLNHHTTYTCYFVAFYLFLLYYYYYHYYYLLNRVFHISVHWSLSDSKSPQIFRILLSILAVLNNVVVWMVSTRPPTSKSSSPFCNHLVTVPNAPITIGIIVTCMFHSFFYSLARSRYLSFFSNSFSFILWSAGTVKSTILQVLFFIDYY